MNKRVKATAVSAVLLASLTGAAFAGPEAILEKWKSLDVAGLTAEAVKLQKRPPSAERDVGLLAQHVARRYAGASASGKLDIKQWLTLASVLSKRLPVETRRAMAKEIQTKLAPNQDAIAKLSYQDCRILAGVLGRLGSKEGPVVLAAWVEKSDAWPSLKLGDLVGLASDLSKLGDAGKKARPRLAGHVETKYLADAETARSVSCRVWRGLARYLAADLSAERRGQWISKLRSAFLVTEMKSSVLGGLGAALRHLGDKDAGGFVSAWMARHETWNTWKPGDLARMAANLAGKSEAATSGRRKLGSHVEAKYLGDAKTARSVSCRDWRNLACYLAEDLSAERRIKWADVLGRAFLAEPTKGDDLSGMVEVFQLLGGESIAQKWAMKVYEHFLGTEKARSAVSLETLCEISRALHKAGLTGRGKEYPELAAAIVSLAKAGKLTMPWETAWAGYRSLGRPLGTKADRRVLMNGLIDAHGNPRLGIACGLAWSYYHHRRLEEWQKYLDGKVAASRDPDSTAMWLMVRAYSASIRPDVLELWRGNPWLTAALGAAKSQDVRLMAVQHLVKGYYQSNRVLTGITLLASIKGQFSGDALKKINSLQHGLRAEHAAYLTKESGKMGWCAGYLEAKARDAMLRGDKAARNYYLSRAQLYRQQQRRLLSRRNQ